MIFIFSVLSFGFYSCGGNNEIKQIIKSTTELEVRSVDTSGKILKTKVISEPKEIEDILSIVQNSEAPTYKCGYNYELYCKTSANNYVTIQINSDDLCANASFLYNGELNFRYLNKGKIDNLSKLLK